MWQFVIAGISLGLVSSLHCIGMCGPLALALPVRHLHKPAQVTAIVLYNAGRIITYSMAGLVMGLAGRRIYLAGFQQSLSIVLGIILLFSTVQYFFFKNRLQPIWLQKCYYRIQLLMGRCFQPRRLVGYLLPGLVNGLLPCGMVYLAIAGALSTAKVSHSVLFMCSFGAGTLPAMLMLSLFGLRINTSWRQQMKKAMPYIVAGMAVFLIMRGLHLGIPFVSPVLPSAPGDAVSCHK